MIWGEATLDYLIDHSEHSNKTDYQDHWYQVSYLPNRPPSPDIAIFHFPSLSFYSEYAHTP
jgi:hypothetical protein